MAISFEVAIFMPEAWAIKMECINGVEPHSHLLLLRGGLIL